MLIKINQMLRNEKGFTIIELMAVLVIIGIIALIAVPRVTGTITQARIRSCSANVQMLDDAVERYAVDHMTANGDLDYSALSADGFQTTLVNAGYLKEAATCPVNSATLYVLNTTTHRVTAHTH